jgi:hypothetical protein
MKAKKRDAKLSEKKPKQKPGRPALKNQDIDDIETNEEHVVDKRGICRRCKNVCKELYIIHKQDHGEKANKSGRKATDHSGLRHIFYDICKEKLSRKNFKKLGDHLEKSFLCQTQEYIEVKTKLNLKLPKEKQHKIYSWPEISDICYKWSKFVKEAYFKDPISCFIFKFFVVVYKTEKKHLDKNYSEDTTQNRC